MADFDEFTWFLAPGTILDLRDRETRDALNWAIEKHVEAPGNFDRIELERLTLERLKESHLGGARLVKPPGARLLRSSDFFFSAKAHSEVFEPVIKDLQDEYFAALAAERHWKARWVWLRGTWSFFAAVFAQCSSSLVRFVLKAIGIVVS